MQIKNIAVAGAGTMGNGIAHVFALFGYKVFLIDQNETILKNAVKVIEQNLDRQVKKETITAVMKESALANISVYLNLKHINSEIDLFLEAVSENKQTKTALLQQAKEIIGEKGIFASNTSSISITELSTASFPERFIGMHFMNPAPVMRLVELIRGYSTSDSTYETIKELALSIQKEPVEVYDYPGFIANRILMPMINEAIFALFEGVAKKKEIDTVMKLGMNHPMGPLALADYIGLDICLSIIEVMYNGFKDPKYRPCPLLVKMVNAGKLGRKSGEGFYKY